MIGRRNLDGYTEPVLQSFRTLNNSAQGFIPAGRVTPPMILADMQIPKPGIMHVHPAPTYYTNVRNKTGSVL
jgi:hypothetical protein